MATNFPTSQDSFTNPSSGSSLSSPSHSQQHSDVNDAVEAIEGALLDGAPLHIDDANERVGIGTTSPATNVHISAGSSGVTSQNPAARLIVEDSVEAGIAINTSNTGTGYVRFVDPDSNAVGGISYAHTDNDLKLRTAGSDRVTIDSSGNVGIGTTSPGTLLNIGGTTNPGTDGEFYVESTGIPCNYYYKGTNTGYSGWKFYSDVTGTAILQALVRADGDFESRTNSYGATSDVAIKQDIVDAPSQWDDIKAVQLRKYRLIDDVTENGDDALVQLGVVAQELEAAGLGGLVVDADPDNDKPHKSVKYSVLLLKALGALQEAMARIEALEAG